MSEGAVRQDRVLSAQHVLEFTYTRSVGPVIGRFFAVLKEGRLVGVRTRDGRVIFPPTEYDPDTGEDTTGEFVEVGPSGVVTTWAWQSNPKDDQPLARPFAWALIRLDGADTSMLHVVDAGDPSRLRTGMRVRVRFREERTGDITDIGWFEPEAP